MEENKTLEQNQDKLLSLNKAKTTVSVQAYYKGKKANSKPQLRVLPPGIRLHLLWLALSPQDSQPEEEITVSTDADASPDKIVHTIYNTEADYLKNLEVDENEAQISQDPELSNGAKKENQEENVCILLDEVEILTIKGLKGASRDYKVVKTALQEGYIYLINEDDKLNDRHEFEVTKDGFLRCILWKKNKKGNAYLDERQKTESVIKYIAVHKDQTYRIAFSPVQWSLEYFNKMCNDEETLDKYSISVTASGIKRDDPFGVDKALPYHKIETSFKKRGAFSSHLENVLEKITRKEKKESEEGKNEILEDMFIALDPGRSPQFKDCSYKEITKKYKDEEPQPIFSTTENINNNNKNADHRTIEVGVLVGNNSRFAKRKDNKLTIEVNGVTVDKCLIDLHSKEKLIDVNYTDDSYAVSLKEDYPRLELENNTSLSIVPNYKYEYLDSEGQTTDYIKFLTTYFPGLKNTGKKYIVPVSSCAFYRKIEIAVIPDVAFAIHFQIGKPEDYTQQNKIYYRNIDLKDKLVRGLKDEITAVKNNMVYLPTIPNKALSEFIMNLLLDYLADESENYAVGFHGYHSFGADKKSATLISYSDEYKVISKIVIAGCLLVSVAVDALILYLTRGRAAMGTKSKSLLSKIKKANTYRKAYKDVKGMINGNLVPKTEPNGVETEFIWPQISEHKAIGYVNNEHGAVEVELIYRLDGAPLFALNHSRKGDLGSLIAGFTGITKVFDTAEQVTGLAGKLRTINKAKKGLKDDYNNYKNKNNDDTPKDDNENETKDKSFNWVKLFKFRDVQNSLNYIEKKLQKSINDFVKKHIGANLAVEFNLKGYFAAHYELKVNLHKNAIGLLIEDVRKGELNFSSENQVTYGTDYGINANLKLEAGLVQHQKWSKYAQYIPDFLGLPQEDIQVTAKIEGEVKGSLHLERTFTYKKGKNPIYKDTLIFTGLILEGFLMFKVEDDESNKTFYSKNDKSKKTKAKEPERKVIEIVPPFTIELGEQSIFDMNTWENAIEKAKQNK